MKKEQLVNKYTANNSDDGDARVMLNRADLHPLTRRGSSAERG